MESYILIFNLQTNYIIKMVC